MVKHWLLLAVSLSSLACGYVSGASELEIVDASAEEQAWGCIGEGAPLLTTDPVAFSAPVRNLASNKLLDDVVGRICEGEPCTSPLAEARAVDGVLTFPPVDPSFRGYLELESPGMMPAVVELLHPIGAMRKFTELRMLATLALKAYSSSLQAEVDEELGQALFWVQNCSGEPAPGVTVDLLDAGLPNTGSYYVVNFELPSPSIVETQESGGGGFVNLPPGFPRFAARRASDQRTIATFAARVRSRTVTFFVIEPE